MIANKTFDVYTNINTPTAKREYNIYIKSEKHPRTINTPMMGRTYFDIITVTGDKLFDTIFNLIENGTVIDEIHLGYNTRIHVKMDTVNGYIAILR